MSPLISVLMPTLNEERHIERAVRGILAQERVEVEVLVIDGGSVDRTRELVGRLAAEDPRVRLLDNPQTSIPCGLNVGLRHSRGEIVARVDAHAEISPDYLARGAEWLARDPQLASVGGLRLGTADTGVGRAIALVLSSPFAVGNSINHFADSAQLTDHASFGVTRARAAREVGGWDETLRVNEDVDFDHRLQMAGHTIGYDPEMIIRWQVRESLPALFRQYRRYGRGKGLMIRKNGAAAVRVRHLVPPAAVVGGGVVLAAGLRRPAVWLLALPYLAVVLLASLRSWRQSDDGGGFSFGVLPAAFVVIHLSWGLGMLEGLALGRQPVLASGSSAVRPARSDDQGRMGSVSR